MYKLLIGVFGPLVVAAAIPIAVIFFDAPASPPPMASMVPPVSQTNRELSTPRHFQARDGVTRLFWSMVQPVPQRVCIPSQNTYALPGLRSMCRIFGAAVQAGVVTSIASGRSMLQPI